jgi:hypothetical protein
MAKYMVQTMQYKALPKKTYYRKQSNHPDHTLESGPFTADAKMNYVTFNHLTPAQAADVEVGPYLRARPEMN